MPSNLTASDTPGGKLESGAPSQKTTKCSSEEQLACSVVPALTAEQEAKLWRRIDLRLIPIITLMYLLSFMDRGNIGNAKLDGLVTQLNLTGNKYNIALLMYFIPYSLLEFPSNLVIQVIRPSRWLPAIMVLWGLAMMFMGFVKTYHQLVGVRVCLGAAEAGFYPGVAYYLTLWYPKYMYQYRIAMFSGAATLAGAFSGLLAYAINFMNGDGGLEGWSWIFILEGLLTILIALTAAFVMVDYPSTAKFLTTEERSFVIERRQRDAGLDEEDNAAQQVWAAFTDWQVWALALIAFSMGAPLYGITYFLPTIIYDFGYSTAVSQLLTIPPYVLATTSLLTTAYFSDKLKLRSPFILAAQLTSLVGYIINISDAPSGVKYFGTYLCVIGTYTSIPGSVSWLVVFRFSRILVLANNLGGRYKRAVGMALQIAVGNLGGAVACIIFRTQDEPRYLLGHGLEIMFISIGVVTVLITVFTYKRINARRDREELLDQQQAAEPKKAGGTEHLGDRALSFRIGGLSGGLEVKVQFVRIGLITVPVLVLYKRVNQSREEAGTRREAAAIVQDLRELAPDFSQYVVDALHEEVHILPRAKKKSNARRLSSSFHAPAVAA
ncbi:MFS general substrate transporter [Melanogaster broomeanus]|nr:MFS general substrate transporter [Melanogaster broomeanus]